MVILVLSAGCSGGRDQRVTYDRRAAVAYADSWALRTNPAYWASPDSDCANFVSQCLAAGGLPPLDETDRDWHANGTDYPTVAWVNCAEQQRALTASGATHSPYIAHTSSTLPDDWAAGDLVYVGNVVAGKTEWQHVIICAGRSGGEWVYDSHSAAHRRVALDVWYPGHFAEIRYCHIAGAVRQGE